MFMYPNAMVITDENIYVDMGSYGFMVLTDAEAIRLVRSLMAIACPESGQPQNLPPRLVLSEAHELSGDRTDFNKEDGATGL